MLLLPSAARTADQSLSMVVMSAEVMFDEVTAAASALYAVVRSVVSCVVGELVYIASNWLRSVESPASVVPEAIAVTRLFSNEVSADWLLGVSPSLASVSKAERIAASSPTVVPEDCSIVRTSLWSVARALESVELDEVDPAELLELPELLELLELLVVVAALTAVSVVDVDVVA